MSPTPLYLDHNAASPIRPEVAEIVRRVALEFPGNPESQHQAGRAARRRLEEARRFLLAALGAETASFRADRLVLTSGGTEANNLAVFGLARAASRREPRRRRVVLSGIEHPSVLQCGPILGETGFEVEILRAGGNGLVDLDHLQELLAEPTCLVSCMLANNETGVIQPIQKVAALAHAAGALVHTDAVQSVGKFAVDFRDLGVDALSFTGHKFGGPKGVGGLMLKWGVEIDPLLWGGFQQAGLRPGTENPPLAAGLQKAVELSSDLTASYLRLLQIRDAFETHLREQIPEIVINCEESPRLPHTSNVAFPGVDRQAFQMALDLDGIYCSTGSACASGSSEPSTVLVAMGLAESVISSSLRFSFGWSSTYAEAGQAAERISLCYKRLRSKK